MQIRKACEQDIQDIEAVLLDAVRWLTSINKRAWSEEGCGLAYLKSDTYHWSVLCSGRKGRGCRDLPCCKADADPIYWSEIKPRQAYISISCVWCVRRLNQWLHRWLWIILRQKAGSWRKMRADWTAVANKPELKHFLREAWFSACRWRRNCEGLLYFHAICNQLDDWWVNYYLLCRFDVIIMEWKKARQWR